ncbi:MAG: MFS transporter [Dermatophilaceae bacterium]|nr:MFS transporter [Actinomycetales bacterium]
MRLQSYRDVVALRDVRLVLALGFLVRLPMFALGIVLTLHVVSTLGRSYGEAGLVSAAFTIALALSAPWRGRLLDRHGLRRTLVPSIVVTSLLWTSMPFVSYAVLLPASVVAGAFAVPSFSILRQALIAAVPDGGRRGALSLDAVCAELSFMIGPAVAVWAAATYDTRWVLFLLAIGNVVAAVALYVANPRMRTESGSEVVDAQRLDDSTAATPTVDSTPAARRSWVTPGVLAVLGAALASTIVLAGTDVSIVAALRDMGATSSIGWVLSLWGAGSLVGGLVYGAWHRSISAFWLLGGLAASTIPVAWAWNLPVFAVLVTICGILCAPTITATVDTLSRVVPERSRGEAMGWHGSAMTSGQAIGAPLAGFAIDHAGWGWGFVSVSIVGLTVAVVGAGAIRVRRTRRERLEPSAAHGGAAATPVDATPADAGPR